MSIKLLLIVSDEQLLNKIYSQYNEYIKNKNLQFYSPKEAEQNNIKYEVIITQYEYLDLIDIKDVPIIVIDESSKFNATNTNNHNIIYAPQPLDLNELYKLIIKTQYEFKSSTLSKIDTPEIVYYTDNHTNLINTHNNHDYNNLKEFDEDSLLNNLQLLTKFYSFEDVKKINNILSEYGKNNKVDDKIIAQASIILDELIYIIESLNKNNMILNNNEPKLMMKINNLDKEFSLNLECIIPIENNIHHFISIANNYGNIIESFKRNNSYFINIHWYY